MEVEKSLDKLQIDRILRMDARGWYDFLHDEYFRWKYTAPNRLASTRKHLEKYQLEGRLDELDKIREQLLALNVDDIRAALIVVCRIKGLGTAGGSGLLSLMYPMSFATVDQFVVKALLGVPHLPEKDDLTQMDPESLTIKNGVLLIDILRRKSAALNNASSSGFWTPRKLEMVLWTYGRD
jgi:hypothetical protein